MLYLIDGYNLLFAMGVLLPGRTGLALLEKARWRLLELLRGAHGLDASSVTVVFDAKHAPRGAAADLEYEGIHVSFAVHDDEADDLIERLIRQAATPRKLTVVSDDHRIQQAARRRHCIVQGCGAYMDQLHGWRQPPPPPPPEEGAKPASVSGEEAQRWLREFADLADDPALKELFEPPWSENGDRPGGSG
jgi:predicted RNA-binding protein with PIN domain